MNFYRKLLTLAIPIMIQQFIQAALNLVDTMMIGRLGAKEIAAVGIANQVFFIIMMIVFGINSGISVYIAQFFGRMDTKNIRKTMGVSLSFAFVIGVFFCLIAISYPRQIMRLFINDPEVIAFGVDYLRIVAFSYVFLAVSSSFHVASRGIGKTVIPMVVSALALSLNTILNYGLIFGNFGFTALGVEGAAIATLIARIFEFFLMILYIYGSKSLLAASIKDLLSYNISFVKKIFDKAGPVLMNEIFWSLGTVMYMWSIGKINADAVASYQITISVYRFYEVIFVGLASGVGVMIGNSIGGNKEEDAIMIAHKGVKLSSIASIGVSLLMWFLAPNIIANFNVGETAVYDSMNLFKIYCVYGVFRVFNLMMIVGILRGGGDTKFAMVTETCSVWLVGVPLGIISAVLLKLPVVLVVWLISTEEIIKAIINMFRLKSNRWVHNVIKSIK